MQITSSRLTLKPLEHEDMNDIHQLISIEEVAKFNTIGIPKSIEVTKEFHEPMIHNPDYLGWSIRSVNDLKFLGIMGLRIAPKRYSMAEIHYSLLPANWNKGLATEAVYYTLKYAFNELKLHRIQAGCAVDNLGSIKVLEKCGFTREGRKRKVLPLKTGWSDNYEYAILEEDFI